jgi:hypothetical protein
MNTGRIAFLALLLCLLMATTAGAQEEFDEVPDDVLQGEIAAPKPKVNNLPFNIYGLSGLMLTTSTRTLQAGSFEVGLAGLWEDSGKPNYYRREMAFLGTVGIPGGLEFGFRVPYVMTDLQVRGYTNNVGVLEREYRNNEVSDLGSIEGMFKWGFVQQHNFLPAFAIGLGGIAPGGTHEEFGGGTSDVKTYGVKAMLALSLELNDLAFTDYAFAIMGDGVFQLRDTGIDNREYEEKSGLVHAGMIFPLHPRNFIELMIEYEGLLMRGTTNDEDTNALVPSLRFVLHHFNLSAGAKYTFKEDPDYDETWTWLATFSYTYF